MKLLVVMLGLTLVTGVVNADTAAAATPTTNPKPPTPATPGAKVDPTKKKEEMGVIKGVEIARANGTFLGLEVVGGRFKLSFYNAKKKPMAADVTRANARWPNKRSGTPTEFRTVFNGSGTALMGEGPVLAPYTFTVRLNLLQGEGENEKAVESFVVPFRG